MMINLSSILNFFRLSETDQLIMQGQMQHENIKRVIYLTIIAVPISIFQCLFFYLGIDKSVGVEHTWKTLIMYSHLLIVIFLTLIGGLLYFTAIRPKKKTKLSDYLIHLMFITLISIGIGITTIDQLVVSAINPFVLACFLSAILLLIRPLYALIYFTISYCIFYFSIALTQTNPEVLLFDRLNAITITGLSLCLSFIFWKMYLLRINQNRIIEEQKNELLENYNKLSFYSSELEIGNKTKDKLFSVIAHDLRSPYTAMIGFTEILTEDITIMSPEEIKETMVILKKEVEHSFDLLNNLLIWSKTQLKKFDPNPEEIHLHQLTSKSFAQLESMTRDKNLSLVNEIDEGLCVIADVSMVQSIMKNLLTNAIKFTPKSGTIVVRAFRNGDLLEVEIQDSGIGMNPEQRVNLFKLNNDFTSLGTEKEQGTGLGLQICKEFIELNGGQIWVDSEIGKGSTFHFSLPLK